MWYAMSVGAKDSAWSTSAQPALLPLMRESSNISVFGAARSLVEVGLGFRIPLMRASSNIVLSSVQRAAYQRCED